MKQKLNLYRQSLDNPIRGEPDETNDDTKAYYQFRKVGFER